MLPLTPAFFFFLFKVIRPPLLWEFNISQSQTQGEVLRYFPIFSPPSVGLRFPGANLTTAFYQFLFFQIFPEQTLSSGVMFFSPSQLCL